MPSRIYKFCLVIKIYSIWIFISNNSAIWLVNTKPQNMKMHGRISPRRTSNPCGYTMKMSSRYHRLLIYDVKITTGTKIDGMGPLMIKMITDKQNVGLLIRKLDYM